MPSTEQLFWDSSEGHLLLAIYEHAKRLAAMQGKVELVTNKGGSTCNVLTTADVWSGDMLSGTMAQLKPDCVLQTEELGTMTPASVGTVYKYVIDELDGSANYLAGLPNYHVLLGRQRLDGERANVPDFGAVLYPANGTIYWGEVGVGAYANATQISVNSELSIENRHVYLRTKRDTPDGKVITKNIFSRLVEHGAKILYGPDEATHLCQIANGNYAGAIIGPHAAGGWHDIAGPLGLVRAAGAHITDWRGGAPSEGNILEHGVLIANNEDNLHALQSLVADATN